MNYNFFWILLIRRLIDDVSEENLCNDDAKVQIVQTTPMINFFFREMTQLTFCMVIIYIYIL